MAHSIRPGRRLLATRGFTLVTDLDGTFAHGEAETRDRLVAALRTRSDVRLIYATGRSPAGTTRLMKRLGLPEPDLLIGDVGSSVLKGTAQRIAELESHIAERWPGGDILRARLDGTKGISEVEVGSPHRLVYLVEAPADMPLALRRVRRRLRDFAVDIGDSAGIGIDVLPAGVNKGATLLRVLDWLDEPDDRVVVAGDAMNDLPLFQTGLRAVLVGNAEPRLARRVSRHGHVHASPLEGVDAIVDGLVRFGLVREDGVAR